MDTLFILNTRGRETHGLAGSLRSVKDIESAIQRDVIRHYKRPLPMRKGSLVKLTTERPRTWNGEGMMDKYLGATLKVSHTDDSFIYFTPRLPWSIRLGDVDEVVKY